MATSLSKIASSALCFILLLSPFTLAAVPKAKRIPDPSPTPTPTQGPWSGYGYLVPVFPNGTTYGSLNNEGLWVVPSAPRATYTAVPSSDGEWVALSVNGFYCDDDDSSSRFQCVNGYEQIPNGQYLYGNTPSNTWIASAWPSESEPQVIYAPIFGNAGTPEFHVEWVEAVEEQGCPA